MTDDRKPFRHPPNATDHEKLLRLQVLRAGSSPFYADEPKAPPIDTSVTATCTCCSPPRRFVGTAGKTAEEWLVRHVESAAVGREQANARRRRGVRHDAAHAADHHHVAQAVGVHADLPMK
jgi:hypothetical protein